MHGLRPEYVGSLLLVGAIASTGASGRKNAGNEAELLVVVLVLKPVLALVVILPLLVGMGLVIFGFRKNTQVAQTTRVCCYRKIPGGFFAKLPENLRR